MLYGIKDISERKDIFDFLRMQVPDLKFNNGMKQKVTSFLYRHEVNPESWTQLKGSNEKGI